MNDTEATDLVHGLAQTVEVADPPLRELVTRGRAARRRRTSVAVLAGLCAVVLVAGFVWTLRSGPGPTAVEPATPADQGATGGPNPSAPEGTKLVGLGRAVVAVPEDWPVVTTICSRPDEDHVFSYSDTWASARCGAGFQASPPGVSVGIGTLDSDVGREIFDSLEDADGNVTDAGLKCGSVPSGQEQHCTQTVVVPSQRAFIAITALQPDADDAVRQVRDSVHLLPEGWTTVPLIEYGASDEDAAELVRAAGLEPVLPDVDWPHYVTGTQPAMGSPVRTWTAVELVPGDG